MTERKLLNEADGGARLHTNWSELLDAPPAAPAPRHARIVVAAVLATALVCWAAQALGLHLNLPFN